MRTRSSGVGPRRVGRARPGDGVDADADSGRRGRGADASPARDGGRRLRQRRLHALDWTRYLFINTELTVHFTRAPAGEWVLLDAQTQIAEGGAELASSVLSDRSVPSRAARRRCSWRRADHHNAEWRSITPQPVQRPGHRQRAAERPEGLLVVRGDHEVVPRLARVASAVKCNSPTARRPSNGWCATACGLPSTQTVRSDDSPSCRPSTRFHTTSEPHSATPAPADQRHAVRRAWRPAGPVEQARGVDRPPEHGAGHAQRRLARPRRPRRDLDRLPVRQCELEPPAHRRAPARHRHPARALVQPRAVRYRPPRAPDRPDLRVRDAQHHISREGAHPGPRLL